MKNKLKIGLILRNFNELNNWELRIINEIINHQKLEIKLIIQDGRIKNSIKSLLKSKFIWRRIFFKLQLLIERFFFKKPNTVNKTDLINFLEKVEKLILHPKKINYVDKFNEKESNLVKNYNLDIIIRHDFSIIRGDILNASKYGIWSFHHGDNSVNRGSPPGFWEIFLKEKYVGVTLQRLTSELDGGLIIDKAYFNRHWSLVKTQDDIFESGVALLMKNINMLIYDNIKFEKSAIYNNPLYRIPNLVNLFKYSISFYTSLANKFFILVLQKLLIVRNDCWTLFIGKGDFLNSQLFRLKPLKLPKNEFWADPFLYKKDNQVYVFFENYSYKDKKGKISCGLFNGKKLINIQDVLNLDYHLSYPFIYKDNDELYLIPETSQNQRLEVYKCKNFPNDWELYSTAFENEIIVDSTLLTYNKEKWLFVNKESFENGPVCNELHIYKIDSLKMDELIPHKQNPVLIDSRSARSAGSFFTYENNLYRPSQSNTEGVYGRALNINIIEKLSIEEYSEKIVKTIKPNFNKNLSSMHHLHQIDELFVFDAAFKKLFL